MEEKEEGTATITQEASNASQGGFLDKVAIPEEKGIPGAEGEGGKPETEGTSAEGAEVKSEAEKSESEKPEEEKSETTEPLSSKLLAGKFQTTEQLEKAYANSSHEGLRLNGRLQASERVVSNLQKELSELRLAKELGDFKELTDEQVESLTPREQARYEAQRIMYGQRKSELERSQKEDDSRASETIDREVSYMESNPGKFPGYVELESVMDALIDEAPELQDSGFVWAPRIVYLAAWALKEQAIQRKSKDSKSNANEEAKKKAEASAAKNRGLVNPDKVISPGISGNGKTEDINDRIIRAANSNRYFT